MSTLQLINHCRFDHWVLPELVPVLFRQAPFLIFEHVLILMVPQNIPGSFYTLSASEWNFSKELWFLLLKNDI